MLTCILANRLGAFQIFVNPEPIGIRTRHKLQSQNSFPRMAQRKLPGAFGRSAFLRVPYEMNAIAQFLLLADRVRGAAETTSSHAQRVELDRLARRWETRALEHLLGVPVIWSDAGSDRK